MVLGMTTKRSKAQVNLMHLCYLMSGYVLISI